MKRFCDILLTVFAVGAIGTLFAGGLALAGYIIAMVIGGDTAPVICAFIYKTYLPLVIKITSVIVGVGLLAMYLTKQKALVASSDNTK